MIDQARIDAIYIELDHYIIDIMEEPRTLGPAYLQERMAVCRNHLNRVSLLFSEVSREKASAAADLRALEDTYKLEYDAALATDESVRRLGSIEDRKSTVSHMLRDAQMEINSARRLATALEASLKVVVHRSRELHATMDILKEERRLMNTDIQTGAMYGDERTEPGIFKDIDQDELDALLSGKAPPADPEAAPEALDGSGVEEASPPVPEAPSEPATPVPEAPPSPAATVASPNQDEEAVIRQFLDAGEESKSAKKAAKPAEEDDLSDFLDSL